VLGSVQALVADGFFLHIGASILRVLASLGISTAVAVPLAVVMGRVSKADAFLRPIVYLLYPIPKIALLPVILLLIGIGNGAKITLLVLVLFFQILVAVRDAVRQIDEEYDITLRALGGSRIDMLRFVIWPTILPRLLTAMRVGSATALAVLFFAETFFTRFGLGYFIVTQWSRLAYVEMYAGIIALSAVGVLLFAGLDLIERRLCPWVRRDETRS
jgi:NitT/TauT family transport system permease protein